MTYQQQLSPWIVQQHLPNVEHRTLARFRRRGDADAYLTVMKQMRPSLILSVIFSVEETADLDRVSSS